MSDILNFKWMFSPKHPFELYDEIRPDGGVLNTLDIHQPVHLQYVISGEMHGRFGAGYITVKPGNIVMNAPWEIHGDDRYTKNFRMINLVIAQNIVQDLLLSCSERLTPFLYETPGKHREFLNSPSVHNDLVPLFEELAELTCADAEILRMKRWLIIQQIFVALLEHIQPQPKQSDRIRKLAPALMLVAERPCSAVEAADACGFSENYFGHLFHESFSMTFASYQLEQRLNRAAIKLRNGMSVKMSATMEQFYDASYFIKCFTRQFGISPGKWCSDSH